MSGNILEFNSRRSPVISTHGSVACSHPLASQIGLDILKAGGNAADAAVAMAAALNVTQPCSTGIGGDAFCLYYDAKTKQVHGLNGSGRAPAALSLAKIKSEGFGPDNPLPNSHGHTVTVPGAPALFVDLVEKYGSKSVSLCDILQPVIELAENGYGVAQITAHFWKGGEAIFNDSRNPGGKDFLINGRCPKWGEIFKNPNLANTLREIASKGKSGYYEGRIAEAIVKAQNAFGGVMTLEDLKNHTTTPIEPISTTYRNVRLWEIPPNGIGIVALIALNIIEGFDVKAMGHNTPDYLHILIEAIRLAYADIMAYGADPSKVKVPISQLLSKEYAKDRRRLIDLKKSLSEVPPGSPWDYDATSDTVYLTTADCHGNACSFIFSNFRGFGTGIVPAGCGFTLQNRGQNFSLEEGHPNVIEPGKRSLHTIIPAMLTDKNTGDLLSSYGVMGGFMQPQGHVQVLLNMLEFGMNPQQALDQPRFCVGPGHSGPIGSTSLEEGMPKEVLDALKERGHVIDGPVCGHGRALMGRGHVITRGAWFAKDLDDVADDTCCLWAGSDPRADGVAVGY